MPPDPIGVAIVGCGRIAASHIDAVAAAGTARLVALVDPDHARAEKLAREHGARAFALLDEALAIPDVNAVVICSPDALHATQSIQALNAGKHVLVEKPMARTSAEARAMAAAARGGQMLAVAHPFRHGAACDYLRVHRPTFGKLRALQITACVLWDGPQAPWWADRPPEEGLVLSLLGPHALDFVCLVMEDDPLRVHVEAARWQPGWRAEDEAMVLLAYPGRRLASIHLSYNQRHVTDRKTLFLDRGVLEIRDNETLTWNDQVLVEPPPGTVADPRAMGGRDLRGFFRAQMREFLAAARGEPNRSVLHGEGVRQIDLLERVLRSARENSAVAID